MIIKKEEFILLNICMAIATYPYLSFIAVGLSFNLRARILFDFDLLVIGMYVVLNP